MQITIIEQKDLNISKTGYSGRVHIAGFAVCKADEATCVLPTVDGAVNKALTEAAYYRFDNTIVYPWSWAPSVDEQIARKKVEIEEFFRCRGFQ